LPAARWARLMKGRADTGCQQARGDGGALRSRSARTGKELTGGGEKWLARFWRSAGKRLPKAREKWWELGICGVHSCPEQQGAGSSAVGAELVGQGGVEGLYESAVACSRRRTSDGSACRSLAKQKHSENRVWRS